MAGGGRLLGIHHSRIRAADANESDQARGGREPPHGAHRSIPPMASRVVARFATADAPVETLDKETGRCRTIPARLLPGTPCAMSPAEECRLTRDPRGGAGSWIRDSRRSGFLDRLSLGR